MAAPSLAIGIGLQGKPIDRATLQMQREIGAQKAVQRKQEQALKELEPFKKTLMDLNNQAYIPVQRELLARKTAGVMKYMTDNIGRIDNYQLSTMINDLASDAATYKSDFQSLSKLRNNDKFVHLQPELEAVFTESVPENFNEKFANNPAFRPQLNQRGGLSYQVFEAKGADKFAQDFIKAEGENFFDVPRIEVIDGQKYEIRSPRQSEFPRFVNAAMSDPSVYSFEASQLFRDLTKAGNMPDVNSAEGKQQFDELLKQRIATKSQDYFNPDRYRPRPSGQGTTFNINTGETAEGRVLAPGQTTVRINDDYSAPLFSFYSLGDKSITIPASNKTFKLGGGRIKRTDTAIYNTIGVAYRVAADKTIKTPLGDRTIKEGTLVPQEELQRMVDNDIEIKPDVVAFFKSGGNNWGYDVATGALQSYFLGESKEDKDRIEIINQELNNKVQELNAIKKSSSKKTSASPAQTPTKTPAPAKTNTPAPVNDRVKNNAALQRLIEENKKNKK
jgi:hypothetical protein